MTARKHEVGDRTRLRGSCLLRGGRAARAAPPRPSCSPASSPCVSCGTTGKPACGDGPPQRSLRPRQGVGRHRQAAAGHTREAAHHTTHAPECARSQGGRGPRSPPPGGPRPGAAQRDWGGQGASLQRRRGWLSSAEPQAQAPPHHTHHSLALGGGRGKDVVSHAVDGAITEAGAVDQVPQHVGAGVHGWCWLQRGRGG